MPPPNNENAPVLGRRTNNALQLGPRKKAYVHHLRSLIRGLTCRVEAV